MKKSRSFCFMVLLLSSALAKKGSDYDCRFNSSKVTVKWIECSPYIYYEKNSDDSNTTEVQAKGNADCMQMFLTCTSFKAANNSKFKNNFIHYISAYFNQLKSVIKGGFPFSAKCRVFDL